MKNSYKNGFKTNSLQFNGKKDKRTTNFIKASELIFPHLEDEEVFLVYQGHMVIYEKIEDSIKYLEYLKNEK